jgi:hypothetical protein
MTKRDVGAPTDAARASEMTEVDLREQLAHIDQMLADNRRIASDIRRIDADHDRKRQEIRYAPWLAVLAGMTTGAALFAAGAAFMKVFQ